MTDAELEARFAAIEARIAALDERLQAIVAAVNRAADYLGVAHVLKDPRV